MSANYYPGADDHTELEALRGRIADLESTVAEQQAQLTHERAEREALQKTLLPKAVATRRALDDLEETLDMNVRAFDARIAEVAAREPSANGPPLSPETARAVANYVRELLARDCWMQLDGNVAGLLIASLRLNSQVCWVLALPPEERITGGLHTTPSPP